MSRKTSQDYRHRYRCRYACVTQCLSVLRVIVTLREFRFDQVNECARYDVKVA